MSNASSRMDDNKKASEHNELAAAFSPDSKQIAHNRNYFKSLETA